MSEGRRESKARLGVFVVSGLVLAVAGVLALGAARIFERTVPLHCYFTESVQGLDPGSPVSYRGVQLGRVSQVLMRQVGDRAGLDMGSAAVIEVVCELFPEQLTRFGGVRPSGEEVRDAISREVSKGLRVRVVWKDITGQKFLDLDYVDPTLDEHRPAELGFEPAEPYIPTLTEKSLTDIQRDLSATISNLAKIDYAAIGGQLQSVLAQIGQKVSDLRTDELSRSFRDAADAMKATFESEKLRTGLDRLDAITAELERAGTRANSLLARPELEQGISDLAASARSLRAVTEGLEKSLPETVARIDSAVDDTRRAIVDAKLPETTGAVRDGVADIAGAARSVAAVREDLAAALREMAGAARSISRLADYLERNPDAVINGRRPAPSGGGK